MENIKLFGSVSYNYIPKEDRKTRKKLKTNYGRVCRQGYRLLDDENRKKFFDETINIFYEFVF